MAQVIRVSSQAALDALSKLLAQKGLAASSVEPSPSGGFIVSINEPQALQVTASEHASLAKIASAISLHEGLILQPENEAEGNFTILINSWNDLPKLAAALTKSAGVRDWISSNPAFARLGGSALDTAKNLYNKYSPVKFDPEAASQLKTDFRNTWQKIAPPGLGAGGVSGRLSPRALGAILNSIANSPQYKSALGTMGLSAAQTLIPILTNLGAGGMGAGATAGAGAGIGAAAPAMAAVASVKEAQYGYSGLDNSIVGIAKATAESVASDPNLSYEERIRRLKIRLAPILMSGSYDITEQDGKIALAPHNVGGESIPLISAADFAGIAHTAYKTPDPKGKVNPTPEHATGIDEQTPAPKLPLNDRDVENGGYKIIGHSDVPDAEYQILADGMKAKKQLNELRKRQVPFTHKAD